MKDLYNVNDWTDATEHLRIGEILVDSGKINLIQLGMALDVQKFNKLPLGQILLDLQVISSADLYAALDLQSEIDEMISYYKKS